MKPRPTQLRELLSSPGIVYGPAVYDCVGAAVVGSAKLNGHFNFHYDEMLGNEDYGYEWLITGWKEI